MTLLAAACLVIYLLSRRHRISHANVTDSHEVLVLSAATPPTADADDPRMDPPKPKKPKKPKAKSAA
jgi:PiT family inorganic phosphate transporter